MDDKIILYSTHCSRCKGLELALKKNNIQYEEVYIDPNKPEEVKIMIDMGLQSAPGLVVNGEIKDFNQVMKWIKER